MTEITEQLGERDLHLAAPPDVTGWAASGLGMAVLGTAGLLPTLPAVALIATGLLGSAAVLSTAGTRSGRGAGHGITGLLLTVVGAVTTVVLAIVTGFTPPVEATSSGVAVPVAPAGPAPAASGPGGATTPPIGILRPAAVGASATAPPSTDSTGGLVTFAAANVLDGDPTTAWRVDGDGVGSVLAVRFAEPVHLTRIEMVPGYAKIDPGDGTDRFGENGRVAIARFAVDGGPSVRVNFQDAPTMQGVDVDLDAGYLEMTILSSVPGTRSYTAVAEIGFRGWRR